MKLSTVFITLLLITACHAWVETAIIALDSFLVFLGNYDFFTEETTSKENSPKIRFFLLFSSTQVLPRIHQHMPGTLWIMPQSSSE